MRERGREGGRGRERERESESERESVSHLLTRQGRLGEFDCSRATLSPRPSHEYYDSLYRVSRRLVSL